MMPGSLWAEDSALAGVWAGVGESHARPPHALHLGRPACEAQASALAGTRTLSTIRRGGSPNWAAAGPLLSG